MPTLEIKNDMKFFYTDSGPPSHLKDYVTLIIIHGSTFNSSIFKRISSLASGLGLRIVALNRRSYAGSTPYSDEELRVLSSGSVEERSQFMENQGIFLALFVDGLIRELQLGTVAISGWSFGCAFLLMLVGAIEKVEEPCRINLREHVKSIILWDPPSRPFGFENPPEAYTPYDDPSISTEEKFSAFSRYVSGYYTQEHLASRDPSQLNYRHADPDRRPSVENMTAAEKMSILDFNAGLNRDNPIIGFRTSGAIDLLLNNVINGLLNVHVREAWNYPVFSCIYGDKNPWFTILAVWALEDLVNDARDPKITLVTKAMKGANHIVMWDDPKQAIIALEEIVRETSKTKT